uniref:Uncharacterized protein n=1 Tax=Gopherus agassizii TaxID=38772 RepID=A0A452GWD8_9SAUR
MATLFSNDGAEVVQRALPAKESSGRTPAEALDEFYELERAAAFVTAGEFHRVALQFPDELLVDSAAIAAKMEEATGSKMYILGDTSYGWAPAPALPPCWIRGRGEAAPQDRNCCATSLVLPSGMANPPRLVLFPPLGLRGLPLPPVFPPVLRPLGLSHCFPWVLLTRLS